ncbi:MAG TPA: cytoplasmic protein [Lachnospiraceae bacterium]|nr:cytoplasmic protein [Lachnospiraceae bacterium]
MNFELVSEKKKIYSYDYDEYEEGKGAEELIKDILADPDFPNLNELIIGDWGGAWEDDCQPIIDGIVEHAKQFSHIEKLFVGDMDFESCEVSWIMQGNYEKLWAAMPQLKELTIKGSSDLKLGTICHENLESLTIICGGLPESVIKEIQEARLPGLKKLLLYIGIDDYGFDGDADTIRELLEKADFPQLKYLGITDSEIQDELVKVVLESKFMGQIRTLDLSMGTLTDESGALLLETLPQYPNIKKLDLHHNYLSETMAKKLESLPVVVDVSEIEEPWECGGQMYMNAMLTE